MEQKRQKSASEMRKLYAFVMLLFPSVLLVICTSIDNFLTRTLAQILLFVLQILVAKGIIDSAYQEY